MTMLVWEAVLCMCSSSSDGFGMSGWGDRYLFGCWKCTGKQLLGCWFEVEIVDQAKGEPAKLSGERKEAADQ